MNVADAKEALNRLPDHAQLTVLLYRSDLHAIVADRDGDNLVLLPIGGIEMGAGPMGVMAQMWVPEDGVTR